MTVYVHILWPKSDVIYHLNLYLQFISSVLMPILGFVPEKLSFIIQIDMFNHGFAIVKV